MDWSSEASSKTSKQANTNAPCTWHIYFFKACSLPCLEKIDMPSTWCITQIYQTAKLPGTSWQTLHCRHLRARAPNGVNLQPCVQGGLLVNFHFVMHFPNVCTLKRCMRYFGTELHALFLSMFIKHLLPHLKIAKTRQCS